MFALSRPRIALPFIFMKQVVSTFYGLEESISFRKVGNNEPLFRFKVFKYRVANDCVISVLEQTLVAKTSSRVNVSDILFLYIFYCSSRICAFFFSILPLSISF